MDELPHTPYYLKYFDVTDIGFPWREHVPDQIVRRRADMNDKFIFDTLLISGGVGDPDTLFPPRSLEDLEALLLSIEESTYDTLKQECLVYMLLKWHQDGREERFQLERCIPPHFAALADAYWHLDTGIDIERAVSILSDNRLNGEFASKILHAISISANSSPLIVEYVRTAKPLLTEPQDVWMYTLALADSSLLEAWSFQRTFGETDELREQLLERLFHWCIYPEPRPLGLKALLSLPLSPFEERFLQKYALEPPMDLSRASIAILRDLLCVRLIQSGQYAEAIKVDHQFASSTLNETQNDSRDRRKMIQNVRDALPKVERMLLDMELENLSLTEKTKPTMNGVVKPSSGSDANDHTADLSQSWEEVSRPQNLNDSQSSSYRDILQLAKTPKEDSPTSHSKGRINRQIFTTGAPSPIPPNFAASTSRASPIRQSFPLSASTSTRSQNPIQLVLGSNTGTPSSSGPFSTISHSQSAFVPASRQPNAFYQPPPVKPQQGVKRPIEALALDSPAHDMEMDGIEDDNQDMDLQQEDEGHHDRDGRDELHSSDRRSSGQRHELQDGAELGFSIFGNGGEPSEVPQPRSPTKPRSSRSAAVAPTSTSVSQSKTRNRAPPGAFVSDSEDGGEEEEPPAARTRTSARARQSQARTRNREETRTQPQNKRTKRLRKEDLGRSLPGSLMDDDDDDEGGDDDGEEADQIAPLPQQISPPRRNARRTRSTTPASDLGDEDGAQKRRRSSRLSTATSGVFDSSPPSKKSASAKGRKSTKSASAATKKKRS